MCTPGKTNMEPGTSSTDNSWFPSFIVGRCNRDTPREKNSRKCFQDPIPKREMILFQPPHPGRLTWNLTIHPWKRNIYINLQRAYLRSQSILVMYKLYFPVHKSSSATSASEQLLELLLLKELSEAAAFSARLWHGVKPRFWARGTPPCAEAPFPHVRGSGEQSGRRELLKQQQLHS